MSATILIVDDEQNARHMLNTYLTQAGYEVRQAATLGEARPLLPDADIVLLDVKLPDGYGPILLEESARLPNRPAIILVTAFGEIEMAVDAMKNGAHDFLQKPIQFERLEQSIRRASEQIALRREVEHYRAAQRRQLAGVVFQNAEMRELLRQAQRAAQASVSVLITGETGTGKEVLARAIHQMGTRAAKPFVAINCAAIQSTMIESELFGYEAGAFTGAQKRKIGLMETADSGILFLDEISSMPLDMQAKLLRALAERAFRRVGGTNEIKVDVQIVAASNRNLPAMIANGSFREDLYYRLKVVNLDIPPLRQRRDEIPALVGRFIQENNPRQGLNIQGCTPAALEVLMQHSWPGNIRELRNVIERAMLFCDDPLIDLPHLPPEIAARA
ncbi:MAG: sigma-54 dependent transcriptional regulator [Anaerolineales bacterium]